MVRFDGRVAIVTGGATGIGKQYALLLASRGARVVVNDFGVAVDGGGAGSDQPAIAAVDEIKAAGGQAIANHGDVADPASADRIVATALDAWGRLDIVVNNAGILREGSLQDMSLEAIEKVIAVNLMGNIYCSRAALPAMIRQGYGRIVLTSSGSGLLGYPGHGAYGAAKSGVVGLMNCLVRECKGTGVLVNAIAPSAETRMSQGLVKKELARNMSPHLVAPMVAWLASENCAESGELINAFGGYFFKVALFKSQGKQFDPQQPVTPEMIDGAWGQISDMSQCEQYLGTIASLEPNLRKLGRI